MAKRSKAGRMVGIALILSAAFSHGNAASSKAQQASALRINKADAAKQIDAYNQRKGFHIPVPSESHSCTEFYEIGNAKVVDTGPGPFGPSMMIVKAVIPIRAKTEIQAGGWQARNCFFPSSRSVWTAGTTISLSIDYPFQQWESGWKLAKD